MSRIRDKKWEREWDKVFKQFLGGHAIVIGNRKITFNDVAKQKIEELVVSEIHKVAKKHNTFAIGYEKSEAQRKSFEEEVRVIIRRLKSRNTMNDKLIKSLNEILK